MHWLTFVPAYPLGNAVVQGIQHLDRGQENMNLSQITGIGALPFGRLAGVPGFEYAGPEHRVAGRFHGAFPRFLVPINNFIFRLRPNVKARVSSMVAGLETRSKNQTVQTQTAFFVRSHHHQSCSRLHCTEGFRLHARSLVKGLMGAIRELIRDL